MTTFHDEHGSGEELVLLHPGGADSTAFDANVEGLAAHHRVLRYDRAVYDDGFEAMAREAIAFVEAHAGGPAHLVGHSDGAIVGLLAARARPDLVRGLVFSSGVFHHEGWLPGTELDELHLREPALTPGEIETIATPTLVMVADADEVAFKHVLALHRHLPHAQLAVVPGEDHGHPAGRPDLFAAIVTRFLADC